MIDQGHRVYDVCGDNIPATAQYDAITIPERFATAVQAMLEAQQITTTQQPDGSVRIDVCLDCRMTLGDTSGAIH